MTDDQDTTDDAAQACLLVLRAALAVARRQSAPVARHADDIAMNVVTKFLERSVSETINNPVAWARSRAKFDCTTLAGDLARPERQHQALSRECDDFDDWQAWITDKNPSSYPYRTAANADAFAQILGCLSDRERLVVTLSTQGYSHEEFAEQVGYSGARVVTTTLSRIRRKVTDASGSLSMVLETSVEEQLGQLFLSTAP